MIKGIGNQGMEFASCPKKSAPAETGEKKQLPSEDSVCVSFDGTGSTAKTKSKTGKKIRAISMEKIDTSLEAACTPIGDPGLLSVVMKALDAKKNLSASGVIRQGSTEYKVDFSLKNNEKDGPVPAEGIIAGGNIPEKGYDYSLKGKMGSMDMNLHCYQSGLSLIIDGNIGNNRVELKNSYNILTGKITTKGNMGQVGINFTTKTSDKTSETDGTIGKDKFYEKITVTADGARAQGKLGALSISGGSSEVSPGKYQTANSIGDAEVKYNLQLV